MNVVVSVAGGSGPHVPPSVPSLIPNADNKTSPSPQTPEVCEEGTPRSNSSEDQDYQKGVVHGTTFHSANSATATSALKQSTSLKQSLAVNSNMISGKVSKKPLKSGRKTGKVSGGKKGFFAPLLCCFAPSETSE